MILTGIRLTQAGILVTGTVPGSRRHGDSDAARRRGGGPGPAGPGTVGEDSPAVRLLVSDSISSASGCVLVC
jgi:hypothetical protein